jgi:hypothetical protein
LAKALEYVGQETRRDPLAAVRDLELNVRVAPPEPYRHRPALGRELDGLIAQVPHDLLQPIRITVMRPACASSSV